MNKTKETLVRQLMEIGVIALPEYGEDKYSIELIEQVSRICNGLGIKEEDGLLPALADHLGSFAGPQQIQFRLVKTNDPEVCELEIAGFPYHCIRMQSVDGKYSHELTEQNAESLCYALHKPYFDNGLPIPALRYWKDPTGSYLLDLPVLYALKIYLHNLAVEKSALIQHIH